MKAALFFAAAAAALAAAPAQAAFATVCQPGLGEPGFSGTPPSFTTVEVSGRALSGGEVTTPRFSTTGENCLNLAEFEWANDAVLTIRWFGSGTVFEDHTATCNLAQDDRCSFPASDLKVKQCSVRNGNACVVP